MNEQLWFFVELFSSLLLLAGGMALTMKLTRRWYMKRNGQDRLKNYANETHRNVTRWFTASIAFLTVLPMNLGKWPGYLSLFVIIFPLCSLYLVFGTYQWKKESNNNDDYWCGWWILGGIFEWLMLLIIGRQWLEI
ncbi:hypothetical protein CHL76_14040 [Marinococcus halophilus]|uniref:DUF4181 domain-containing protein n=1 Tax=Marinococcus halophilus TaxID=1371 RepID=A0A510YAY4_MARHA|nr:hypothetical protein [Marinococcus halophilus]OZT79162.1 hypothetical protein CHL76_14040 [Marinococcus halophilus]GEK59821.1 hypothetical protein MHA01_27260 [Marinococcus halophilus]